MRSKNNNEKNKKKSNFALVIIAALAIVAAIATVFFLNKKLDNKDKDFSYTELLNCINNETVEKIEMKEGSDTAKVKIVNEEKEKQVLIPSTDSFVELVQEKVNNGSKIESSELAGAAIKAVGAEIRPGISY